jgi:hypothetical protein
MTADLRRAEEEAQAHIRAIEEARVGEDGKKEKT